MEEKKVTSKELGERLRDEMKRQKKKDGTRYTNKDLAKLLGYSSDNGAVYVSYILHGKRNLPDEKYQILSDAWHIRVEYLKCQDGFRTVGDMLDGKTKEQSQYINDHIKFLDSLGFHVTPIPGVNTSFSFAEKHLYSLSSYIDMAQYEHDKMDAQQSAADISDYPVTLHLLRPVDLEKLFPDDIGKDDLAEYHASIYTSFDIVSNSELIDMLHSPDTVRDDVLNYQGDYHYLRERPKETDLPKILNYYYHHVTISGYAFLSLMHQLDNMVTTTLQSQLLGLVDHDHKSFINATLADGWREKNYLRDLLG